MIALRGSWERQSELTGFLSRVGVALLGAIACLACSEGGTEPPADNAGTSSMGGSGGNATGNNGGSGGSVGGTAGGGGSGTGGSAGGGGPVAASTFYNFDASVEGFRINYICTAAGACMAINPGMAPATGDAGAGDAGTTSQEPDNGLATVSHDPAVGNPQPGSVQVDIDFTAAGQLAVLALNFNATDFTGRTLSALVTVESGAPAQLVGKMYIKTGELYVYADSGEKLLPAGTWTPFSFNPASPSYTANAMYNPADVREIGFEFSIPMATAGFTPAEIHVDTVQF